MGIQVEFNPDLALRKFNTTDKDPEECVPEKLEQGKEYDFKKKGQRNYWLGGEIPLLTTDGNQNLSRPLASIIILESTHKKINDEIHTVGKYRIIKVLNPESPDIHFEGFSLTKKV
jgi:hypothetical protein